MSNDGIIPVGAEFTMRYRKSVTGLVVGFIREFPFITSQRKTLEELRDDLMSDLGLYFDSFPEAKQKLAISSKVVGQSSEQPPQLEIKRPDLDEVWLEEPILVLDPQ
ncbi:MAG: hypothetical protein WB988_04805 [Candidatus Nitrosopolaris sp.]